MHPVRFTLVVLLALLAPFAPALGTSIDYQGYAYETGGFPPSVAGDTLRIPIVVTTVTADLGFDLTAEELTGWVTELVSTGAQDLGGGVQRIEYSAGRIEIYRDPARDHDFGTSPPNATVPASFTNGAPCLAGSLTDFVLFLDGATSTGAYQGNVVFDAGQCLALLHATRAEGFTFGGVIGRAAPGGNSIPSGYDLSVDGYLEARKIPALCPLPCLAITEAKLGFARRSPRRCGPREGKFEIEGNFTPCAEGAPLDPSLVEVRVRIGDYVQVFPPGALRRQHRRHEHRTAKWKYSNERAVMAINTFEIERRGDDSWEFEIEGRGIPRSTLVPVDNRLDLDLVLGEMGAMVQVVLVQGRKGLYFRGDECACRPRHAGPELETTPPGLVASIATASVQASPNPFNATTTIALRTVSIGDVRLRIFDVRGRLVRTLQAGLLPAGEHRFRWDGTDAQRRAVASGIYIYRVEAPDLTTNGKLVVAK